MRKAAVASGRLGRFEMPCVVRNVSSVAGRLSRVVFARLLGRNTPILTCSEAGNHPVEVYFEPPGTRPRKLCQTNFYLLFPYCAEAANERRQDRSQRRQFRTHG